MCWSTNAPGFKNSDHQVGRRVLRQLVIDCSNISEMKKIVDNDYKYFLRAIQIVRRLTAMIIKFKTIIHPNQDQKMDADKLNFDLTIDCHKFSIDPNCDNLAREERAAETILKFCSMMDIMVLNEVIKNPFSW